MTTNSKIEKPLSKSCQTGFRNCLGCAKLLPIIDFYSQARKINGNLNVMSRCKQCYNKQCIDRKRNSAKAKEGARLAKKRWVSKNLDKHRKSSNDCHIRLTDGVVASTLNMIISNVPRAVIELKRSLIQLNREIRKNEKH